MKVGKLTVNVGSMFSGKSTELLRQGRRYELAGKRVLYVKPVTDDRYSEAAVVTHDRKQTDALQVDPDDTSAIIKYVKWVLKENPDAVLIDEGQFFTDVLFLHQIEKMLVVGIDVYVSGLDMDRSGKPFGIMPELMAVADRVQKFHAVCAECGTDAYVSYAEDGGGDQVKVGGAETYKPLCRSCWSAKKKK